MREKQRKFNEEGLLLMPNETQPLLEPLPEPTVETRP
jgi:hypothetical protein